MNTIGYGESHMAVTAVVFANWALDIMYMDTKATDKNFVEMNFYIVPHFSFQ